MSSQIPRPASTTTNSSTSTSSTSTTRQFSGSMDAYTLSMYEHTQRLMAAAQIPYTSPLNITSPGERGPSGTGSVVTLKMRIPLFFGRSQPKPKQLTKSRSYHGPFPNALRRSSAPRNTLDAVFSLYFISYREVLPDRPGSRLCKTAYTTHSVHAVQDVTVGWGYTQ
ncbi:hypothetical protein CSIM01_05657 [Colletotrichum simmondsii]|uniref:Uncharacterized protein n=1 Tax=Colletotrichum simmondsii TaxID=703756 RepID=A0A135SRJ8_9PEZI|nr:hypothetical protein CSIM01_05657 [Colletotrichum simmondsii]